MRALKFIPQYTVKDYNLWEGDWELIDGIPYSMSPSPLHNHQRLGALLLRQIGNSIEKQKKVCGDCREVYELDWIIDDTTVVRPDIAILCGKPDGYISSPPALIIEILSPSTAYKDRHAKFEIYGEQGVQYYIVVDPEIKTHTVYSLFKDQYQEQKGLTDFPIHGKCKVHIDIIEALSAL